MAMLRARGGRSVTFLSSITMSPSVGRSSPAIIRINVVLPQPDGPSNTKNSPSFATRLMPSTARTSSNSLVTRRASTTAIGFRLDFNRELTSAKRAASRHRRLAFFVLASNEAGLVARTSDHPPVFPFRPDCFHLGLGAIECVFRRLGAGRALGEHGVDHPRVEGFVDRSIRIARITDVRRPIEDV